ncbi:MAG: CoA-binding protein [Pseudomonadota bacterium]
MNREFSIESDTDLSRIIREMQTVAVVGMKNEKQADAPAYRIPQMVQEHGIRVIPVNPTIRFSLGEPAYPNLAAVPDRFDTVNIFCRSEFIEPIADEILALPIDRHPRVVWMQTGIRNVAAARKLSDAGIEVVLDRCLGIYVARYR